MGEHRTALRRAGPVPAIIVGLAVAVAAVMIGVRVWEDGAAARRASQGAAEAPGSSAAAPAEATPPTGGAASPDSPEVVALLERLSSNGLVRRSVAEGDWVRRWAIVTDNLAEGVSPRRQLAFAAPAGPFTVERRGALAVISADSYRRYDAFADAVASVDSQVLGAVYRAVHGPVQAAYHALGYPSAPFDAVVSRALHRIETAPVVDGDVAVRAEGGVFVFDQPRLESLRAVEKHLLRMGPRNTRLLQAKAREIRQALGLPAPERTANVR